MRSFEENIIELRKIREENHLLVEKDFDHFVSEIDYKVHNTNNNSIKKIEINNIVVLIILILILCIGFIKSEDGLFYLFGFIFFIVGMFIGLKEKGFGLIFLLSHGGSGFGIMIFSLMGKYLNEAYLSDISFKNQLYFGTIIFFFVVGLLLTIIHNLSDNVKKNKYFTIIVFSTFLIGFLMASLFPL